jgi:hypothetical protein
MQSAKKHLSKALPAISMAAAAVLAAKSAQAQLVTPYYGNAGGSHLTSSATTWTTNSVYLATNSTGNVGITYENITGSAAQTITVPVGDYLFLAVDVVTSSNPNGSSDAGKVEGNTTGDPGAVQPSYLGLATLGITVPSSDSSATYLQPLLGASAGASYAQGWGYSSKAVLNTSQGQNTGGANVPPAWASKSPGDAETGNGSVALNDYIGGGTTSVDPGTATGAAALAAFGGSSATYGSATPVFDKLSYYSQANGGTVTLSPQIVGSATDYWTLHTSGGGNTSGVPTYAAVGVNSSNVGSLPVLVIKTGSAVSTHAIVSLAAGTTPGSSYGSNVAALTLPYQLQTIANTTTGSATASGWSPATEKEVFGLEVLDAGNPATVAQLGPLITAINSGDANVSASTGVVAYNNGGMFPSPYNMTLVFAGGVPGGLQTVDDLGIDLSSTNDPLLAGLTFTAVAVVPEPMSLGILALGGVGLMARRSRRKA